MNKTYNFPISHNPNGIGTCHDSLTRLDWTALILFTITVFIITLIINEKILQNFPNSADEHAYLYQAKTFALGRISVPAHPLQEFFSPFYIHTHNGRVFSIFPPGWPLILSVGVKLGYPELVNPVLGACTIPLIFLLAKMLWGKTAAWLSVILLAASPFFLFNSASYFSHPACLVGIIATTLFFVLWIRNHHPLWGFLAGLLFGVTFSIRELTTVAMMAIPFTAVLFKTKRKIIFLSAFLIGCAPGLLAYLWYNAYLTGTWFVPVRFLMEGEWLGFGWHENRLFDYSEKYYYSPIDAFYHLFVNVGQLFYWTFPLTPILAVWGMILYRKNIWPKVITLSCISLPFVYLLYPSAGGNQYGPRFYYELSGFLCMFASIGVISIAQSCKKYLKRPLFALLLLVLLVFYGMVTVQIGKEHKKQIQLRRTLYRLVERRNIPFAVVIVGSPSGDMTQGDLIRNPPLLSEAEVLYAWDLGVKNRELFPAFPNRSFYYFGYDDVQSSYYLVPADPKKR